MTTVDETRCRHGYPRALCHQGCTIDAEFDIVARPKHYNSHPSGVECIEITRHMTFDPGNAFKYVFRAELKSSALVDLDKGRFYLRDAVHHGSQVWVPRGYLKAREALNKVITAETDWARRNFYYQMGHGAVRNALNYLHNMIESLESNARDE